MSNLLLLCEKYFMSILKCNIIWLQVLTFWEPDYVILMYRYLGPSVYTGIILWVPQVFQNRASDPIAVFPTGTMFLGCPYVFVALAACKHFSGSLLASIPSFFTAPLRQDLYALLSMCVCVECVRMWTAGGFQLQFLLAGRLQLSN